MPNGITPSQSFTNIQKGNTMKSPLTLSKINRIVTEIQQRYKESGKPVSLNELPLWKPFTKSKKIKIGRGFKKLVEAGEVEGIKFVGVRKDNHSTYIPTDASVTSSSSGLFGFFQKILR